MKFCFLYTHIHVWWATISRHFPYTPFLTHFFSEDDASFPITHWPTGQEEGLVHVGGLWLPGQWQAEPQLSEQLLFESFLLPGAHLSQVLLSSWVANSLEPGGSLLKPGGESSMEWAPEDGPSLQVPQGRNFCFEATETWVVCYHCETWPRMTNKDVHV